MKYLLILSFLVATSLASSSNNIGHANCSRVPRGWAVSNPLDCGSYFICEYEIQYKRCPPILHFDAQRRVCNWPDKAKCDWTSLPSPNSSLPNKFTETWDEEITTPTPTTDETTAEATENLETEETNQKEVKSTEITQEEVKSTEITQEEVKSTEERTVIPEESSQPSTISISTTPPQTENFTTVVTSKGDLTWFCEKVISSNATAEEVGSRFGAYDPSTGKFADAMATYDPEKIRCSYQGVYFLPHPTSCENYYICAHHILIAHSCGVGASWNYRTSRCDIALKSKCYRKEINKSTTKHTLSSTWTKTSIVHEPARNISYEETLACPKNIRAYYPHNESCNKYYICIGGLPVLTKCPKNFYWDNDEKYCRPSKYTECKSRQKQ